MRRAILVTAGTVAGLVALLDYKSGGTLKSSHVAVGGGVPVSTGSTTGAPSTTAPATTAPPTSSPAGSSPASSTTAPPATTAPAGPASYTGADVTYVYGTVQVRITVAGKRITAISIPQESANDPHSADINGQAIPILTQEALAAQGVRIDVVSGATYTSDAFAQALQSAISKEAK
jgi:uncharacterized protein with FMN-binding domain